MIPAGVSFATCRSRSPRRAAAQARSRSGPWQHAASGARRTIRHGPWCTDGCANGDLLAATSRAAPTAEIHRVTLFVLWRGTEAHRRRLAVLRRVPGTRQGTRRERPLRRARRRGL